MKEAADVTSVIQWVNQTGNQMKQLKIANRTCGECTKCCEGWLSANIKGHSMYPGCPCFFLSKGKCTDYVGRPDVCKTYNCAWLAEQETFPEWMRPDLTGVIISKIILPSQPDLTHYEVAEAGGKLDVKTLNWMVQWSLNVGVNLYYQIEGKHHAIGSDAFKSYMMSK